MLKMLRIPLALLLLGLLTVQCKHETDFSGFPTDPPLPEPSATCSPDTVYFVNTVLPLIRSSCAKSGCHDLGSAEHGVVLTDYYRITITGNVKPGNPNGSKLYRVLSKSGEEKMPPSPNSELSNDQKALIARWIEQGALNNYCTEACNPDNFAFTADILPIIQTNCQGCHSGSQPSAGIHLDDYASIKAAADEGSLYGSIAWLSGYQPMPQNAAQLSDCNINQIKNWIDNGAPNN